MKTAKSREKGGWILGNALPNKYCSWVHLRRFKVDTFPHLWGEVWEGLRLDSLGDSARRELHSSLLL